MEPKRSTLVIGLGNPILGDDGVGWRVAEAFRHQLTTILTGCEAQTPSQPVIDVDCLAVGGLSLMELMVGYNRVILIDACSTGTRPIGTVSSFSLEQLANPAQGHLSSAHDASLQDALAVGRLMGAQLPSEIWVVAIETLPTFDFSEQLSPAVAAAVPVAVDNVFQHLPALNNLDVHPVNHSLPIHIADIR